MHDISLFFFCSNQALYCQCFVSHLIISTKSAVDVSLYFIKFAERLLVCVGVELANEAALNLAKREFFENKMHFLQREVDDLDIPANYIMITTEMIAI